MIERQRSHVEEALDVLQRAGDALSNRLALIPADSAVAVAGRRTLEDNAALIAEINRSWQPLLGALDRVRKVLEKVPPMAERLDALSQAAKAEATCTDD